MRYTIACVICLLVVWFSCTPTSKLSTPPVVKNYSYRHGDTFFFKQKGKFIWSGDAIEKVYYIQTDKTLEKTGYYFDAGKWHRLFFSQKAVSEYCDSVLKVNDTTTNVKKQELLWAKSLRNQPDEGPIHFLLQRFHPRVMTYENKARVYESNFIRYTYHSERGYDEHVYDVVNDKFATYQSLVRYVSITDTGYIHAEHRKASVTRSLQGLTTHADQEDHTLKKVYSIALSKDFFRKGTMP